MIFLFVIDHEVYFTYVPSPFLSVFSLWNTWYVFCNRIVPPSNLGFKACVWIIILKVRSIWYATSISYYKGSRFCYVWRLFLARHLPCWKCVNRYLLLLCKIKRHWDRHGCIDTLHRCSCVKSKQGQVQCRCAYVQQSTCVLMHAQVLHFDLILFVGSKHVNFFCWRFRCSKLEWSGDIYRLVQSILTWFFQDRYVII